MNDKFKDVQVDEDTTIHLRKEDLIGGFDVLLGYWTWEGVSACSAIFYSDDVAHLTDEQLIALVREECKTETVTFTRSNDKKYVFVQYGCRYDDY